MCVQVRAVVGKDFVVVVVVDLSVTFHHSIDNVVDINYCNNSTTTWFSLSDCITVYNLF